MNTYTKVLTTRLFEGDDNPVNTEFTVDTSQLTEDDKDIIIASQAAITRQGIWRRKGVIPTSETYVVKKPGTKGTGMVTRTALLKKLCGNKFESVIQKYGDIDKAYDALKSFFEDEDTE